MRHAFVIAAKSGFAPRCEMLTFLLQGHPLGLRAFGSLLYGMSGRSPSGGNGGLQDLLDLGTASLLRHLQWLLPVLVTGQRIRASREQ